MLLPWLSLLLGREAEWAAPPSMASKTAQCFVGRAESRKRRGEAHCMASAELPPAARQRSA